MCGTYVTHTSHSRILYYMGNVCIVGAFQVRTTGVQVPLEVPLNLWLPRLQMLIIMPVTYLQQLVSDLANLRKWEDSIQARQGFSNEEQERMTLSRETLQGLKMTGNILNIQVHSL